jgi:hypothetical protein
VISELSPLFHDGVALIRPEDAQLRKHSWVRFSKRWPNDLNKGGWASGQTFVVRQDTVLVDYPVSRIIVDQDWAVLDLTNQSLPAIPGVPHPTAFQAGTFQMYPVNPDIIYQISVGMKKGDYFNQLQISSQSLNIYQLGSSAIPPAMIDPVYRYLGAKYPKDSPYNSPTWFLYSILNAPQILLNVFMDGGDTMVGANHYGKATIDFRVNKAQLTNITLASIAAVSIPYGSNLTVVVPSGNVACVYGGQKGDTRITDSRGGVSAVANGQETVVPSGWTVQTGSGSALITTMEDVRQWRSIQERALYIPFYDELNVF